MRIKKKMLILTILIIFIFMLVLPSFSVFASNIDNNDFSQYLNCFYNDVYTEDTYITILAKAKYYNVGRECYGKYGEEQIEASKPKYAKVGFKVNGEFYMNTYHLTEDGEYKIEVFFYDKNEYGYYKPHGEALETFKVYMNKGFNIAQNKTTFCYNYDNSEDFLNDVKNSFNETIDMTPATINSIKNFYDNFDGKKKSLGISVIYKNVTYPFTIHLVSLKDVKDSFYSFEEVTKDALHGEAFLYENAYSSYSTLNDALEDIIVNNISKKLKLADGQRFDISFSSKVNMKNIGANNVQTYSIPMIMSEVGTNQEYSFILPVMIYKKNYLTEDKDFMKIEFENNEYYKGQNAPNNYITYLDLQKEDGSESYRDYVNTPSLTAFSLNLNKNTIEYTLNYLTFSKSFSKKVEITEQDEKTRILTKYNYIILPKKDSTDFISQIKVECNTSYKANYNVVDVDGADWLSIEIYDSKTNELLVSRMEKIAYINNNLSLWRKMLKGYGDFLRKIFA